MILRALLVICLFVIMPLGVQAQTSNSGSLVAQLATDVNSVIETQVEEQTTFYGLAGYYNQSYPVLVRNGKIIKLKDETIQLVDSDWLAMVGRFNVLLIQSPGLKIDILKNGEISFVNSEKLRRPSTTARITQKPELKGHPEGLGGIRYSHLMAPIKYLCFLLENILIFLNGILKYWPLSILAVAVLIRVALYPMGRYVKKLKKQVSQTQANLEPRLLEIKRTMKGEEAHNAVIAAHKNEGVSTFYALKPLIGLMVQIPVWIAIFNVLGEMPQFVGQSFLWINDMAYVDAIARWNTPIPLIGNSLNLLPILMTVISVMASIFYKDPLASGETIKKQKRNLVLMSGAFLILFYPFPAVMVLYWTIANILDFATQSR